MSQEHIRRGAGMGWVKRAYHRLHEPRVVSAAYGAWYTILTLVWLRAAIFPPQTIEGAVGSALMLLIAVTITLGGIIGMTTVATGLYWVERTAVALVILGLLGYLAIVLILELNGTGNRQPGLASTAGAIGFTWIRTWWINDRPYNPRIRQAEA